MDFKNSSGAEELLERGPLDIATIRRNRPNWEALLPRRVEWDVASVTVQSLLDRVVKEFSNSKMTSAAMTQLVSGLWAVKLATDEDGWERSIHQCRAHPISRILHQDPFCARSYSQPRGYPGDAVLIDYLYDRECPADEKDVAVSPLGRRIMEFMVNSPAAEAVRARRNTAAQTVDLNCAKRQGSAVLSVACGHMREAARSNAVRARIPGKVVGLDQDELSLKVVQREVGEFGVETCHSNLKALYRGPLAHERFDLIYSTGLYDYLDQRTATKLTTRLFELLNPGGQLLLANFLPDIWICGYMESFMDWKLTYRTPQQLQDTTANIAPSEISSARTFVEDNANIVFLEANKA